MRILAIAALTVTPLLLSACGEGSAFDENFKKTFREEAVSQCVAGAKGSMPPGINVDLEKICGCTADKVMEGKSAAELMKAAANESREAITHVQACVAETYPELMKAPAATAE